MQDNESQHYSNESYTGMITSALVHLLLLLLVLAPLFTHLQMDKPIAGIVVQFGNTLTEDQFAGGDVAELAVEETEDTQAEAPEETSGKATTTPEPPIEETSADEPEIPIEETQEPADNTPGSTKPPEEETSKSAEEEATERANKAAAAKAAEAEQKRQELEKKKAKFGNLLSGGSSNGSQQTGTLEGDPDAAVLEELSAGSGNIGGGLVNRGLLYEPSIQESSQATGIVVLDICVDQTGKVTEARYTQKGSTTTNSSLVAVAKKAALQYKFTAAEIDRQCGNLKIEFKVR